MLKKILVAVLVLALPIVMWTQYGKGRWGRGGRHGDQKERSQGKAQVGVVNNKIVMLNDAAKSHYRKVWERTRRKFRLPRGKSDFPGRRKEMERLAAKNDYAGLQAVLDTILADIANALQMAISLNDSAWQADLMKAESKAQEWQRTINTLVNANVVDRPSVELRPDADVEYAKPPTAPEEPAQEPKAPIESPQQAQDRRQRMQQALESMKNLSKEQEGSAEASKAEEEQPGAAVGQAERAEGEPEERAEGEQEVVSQEEALAIAQEMQQEGIPAQEGQVPPPPAD